MVRSSRRPRSSNREQADSTATPKKHRNYLIAAATGLVVTAICEVFWPDVIPFTFLDPWHLKGDVWTWFLTSLPLFCWGVGLNIAIHALTGRYKKPLQPREGRGPEILGAGFLLALWAGVTEEIAFRWLIFNETIVVDKITGYLLFGWAGFDIHEWIHLYIWGPVANVLTLGFMAPYLYPPSGWSTGAAIVETNAFFRDGHKYQGLLGFVNSWFIGMFFFWTMFRFGLPAAIATHFLYNFFIYVHSAIAAEIRMKLNTPSYNE